MGERGDFGREHVLDPVMMERVYEFVPKELRFRRDVNSISGLASPDQNARQPIRVQDHGNLQSVPLARVTTAVFRRAALAGARR